MGRFVDLSHVIEHGMPTYKGLPAPIVCDYPSREALVGIDSHNIDDTRTRARPVHTVLLAGGTLICEHLCRLEDLPEVGFRFHAVPPKFRGVGTFPVRAYATV